MPANDCVHDVVIQGASNAPVTPNTEAGRQENSAVNEANYQFSVNADEKGRRVYSEEEIAKLLDGRNYTGETAGPQEQRSARSMSREFRETLRRTSAATREEALRENQRIVDMVRNTTAGKANWYANLKNKLYGTFVNDRAELVKYLGTLLDNPNLAQFMNPLIRMFERINPVARGFVNKFKQRIESNLINDLVPLANRTGMVVEDLAVLLGHYANTQHAPERNRFLLDRWRQQLRAETAKDRDQQDVLKVQELARRINNLERFNDTDLGGYDEIFDGPLYHSGYTDYQAREKQAEIIRKTGLTREEIEAWTAKLTAEFNYILQERARNGTLDPDLELPDFAHYVPMLSRHTEGFNNFSGAGNDATPYNPGSYYAAQGRVAPPDSAFVSLGMYIQRAATEIATRDFGFALYAIQKHLRNAGIDDHLKSMSYSDLMRLRMGSRGDLARALNTQWHKGGFIANVPMQRRDRQGNLTTQLEKRFFYFGGDDFEVNGASFSVDMLNRALSSDFKMAEPGPIVGGLARATSVMSMLTTRFSPLFSPVSGVRDFAERAANMGNRTYYVEGDPDRTVGGPSLVASYMANVTRAGDILYKGMRGQLEPGSAEARLWQEFNDNGLMQRYIQRSRVSDKSVAELLTNAREGTDLSSERIMNRIGLTKPTMNRVFNQMGSRRRAALNVIDGWNDYFQNIAAFDQYMTLRQEGVSVRDAADGVLEMMNMSQRGSVAPWLQALAPFVVPTVQSGTAMLRTLGFGARNPKQILREGRKGYATLIAAMAAYSMLAPLARSSMGLNEKGQARYDSLSFDEATRILPIGLDSTTGEYLRFPIGFGLPQLGAMLAVGMERVNQGRMTISDLAFEAMYAGMKNVAPGNWPAYNFKDHPAEFMMSVLTPQPFRPIAEAAMNRNYFGAEIYNEQMDDTSSRADRGRTSTNRRFHELARDMRDAFGVDLQPEVYESLERGYFLGVLRVFTNLANNIDDLYRGSNRPSALDSVHPMLAALGITSWMGKQPAPEQSLFYEAKRHYDNQIRQYGVSLAKPADDDRTAEQYRRDTLRQNTPMSDREIDDYITLWRSVVDLQQLGRDFNGRYKERWLNMDNSYELRQAFDKLDEDGKTIYSDAVQNLYYYNRY